MERLQDLIDVGFMCDLHSDHFDPVLTRQFENVRQTGFTVSLKGVGTCARLVSSHARADLTVLAERSQHQLDVCWCVDGTQSGEYVQRVLSETHTLVIEVGVAFVTFVAADHAILLRHADCPLHAGHAPHIVERDCRRVPYQVNLRQGLLHALFTMNTQLNVLKASETCEQLPVDGAFGIDVWSQNKKHDLC